MRCAADRKEVGAILQMRGVVPGQPQVGFMHQRRALQSVIVAFPLQIVASEFTQLVIHQGHQCLQRLLVPLGPNAAVACVTAVEGSRATLDSAPKRSGKAPWGAKHSLSGGDCQTY